MKVSGQESTGFKYVSIPHSKNNSAMARKNSRPNVDLYMNLKFDDSENLKNNWSVTQFVASNTQHSVQGAFRRDTISDFEELPELSQEDNDECVVEARRVMIPPANKSLFKLNSPDKRRGVMWSTMTLLTKNN